MTMRLRSLPCAYTTAIMSLCFTQHRFVTDIEQQALLLAQMTAEPAIAS